MTGLLLAVTALLILTSVARPIGSGEEEYSVLTLACNARNESLCIRISSDEYEVRRQLVRADLNDLPREMRIEVVAGGDWLRTGFVNDDLYPGHIFLGLSAIARLTDSPTQMIYLTRLALGLIEFILICFVVQSARTATASIVGLKILIPFVWSAASVGLGVIHPSAYGFVFIVAGVCILSVTSLPQAFQTRAELLGRASIGALSLTLGGLSRWELTILAAALVGAFGLTVGRDATSVGRQDVRAVSAVFAAILLIISVDASTGTGDSSRSAVGPAWLISGAYGGLRESAGALFSAPSEPTPRPSEPTPRPSEPTRPPSEPTRPPSEPTPAQERLMRLDLRRLVSEFRSLVLERSDLPLTARRLFAVLNMSGLTALALAVRLPLRPAFIGFVLVIGLTGLLGLFLQPAEYWLDSAARYALPLIGVILVAGLVGSVPNENSPVPRRLVLFAAASLLVDPLGVVVLRIL